MGGDAEDAFAMAGRPARDARMVEPAKRPERNSYVERRDPRAQHSGGRAHDLSKISAIQKERPNVALTLLDFLK